MGSIDKANRWVLIIEDDVHLAKGIGELLTDADFKIMSVEKPQDAIARLKNQKFDCILLDLKLEGGSGEQVISFVRGNKGFNHESPIIVISGKLDIEVAKRISKNVSWILVKPFNDDELLKKVTHVSSQG